MESSLSSNRAKSSGYGLLPELFTGSPTVLDSLILKSCKVKTFYPTEEVNDPIN